MHYVHIPIKNEDDYSISKLLEELMINITEKYPKIELKYGDFIENGYESGYRSNGIYMINKNDKDELSIIFLENHMDDYGTIPENFISFTHFEPGYHFEMEIPTECKSYMHNNYIPISINFLRKQNWIKKGTEKECYFTYKDKKYLIRKNRKYLHKLNNKIIYGQIYLKKINQFDYYRFSSIDNLKEEYNNYDKIILI